MSLLSEVFESKGSPRGLMGPSCQLEADSVSTCIRARLRMCMSYGHACRWIYVRVTCHMSCMSSVSCHMSYVILWHACVICQDTVPYVCTCAYVCATRVYGTEAKPP